MSPSPTFPNFVTFNPNISNPYLNSSTQSRNVPVPEFRDLFNGKDLTGWINVNTAEDTWRVRDGLLICSGHPIGVMRSEKQYENFVLHVEWMHTEPGGNSGVFLWSGPRANPGSPFPDGVEVRASARERRISDDVQAVPTDPT